jgi:hypothetical protein
MLGIKILLLSTIIAMVLLAFPGAFRDDRDTSALCYDEDHQVSCILAIMVPPLPVPFVTYAPYGFIAIAMISGAIWLGSDPESGRFIGWSIPQRDKDISRNEPWQDEPEWV